jgi:hypothetical protein
MSAVERLTRFSFIGLLAVGAFVMLVGTPAVEAQMSGLSGSSTDAIVTTPGFLEFCLGNPCPRRTCDEVNDRCVGHVTLQPAAGEPLVGLTASQLDRFEKGKTSF